MENKQANRYSETVPGEARGEKQICTFAVSLLAKEEYLGFSTGGVVFLTLCCRTLTSNEELLLSLPFCDGETVPSMLTLAGDGADMLVLESISSDDRPGDNIIWPQPYKTNLLNVLSNSYESLAQIGVGT